MLKKISTTVLLVAAALVFSAAPVLAKVIPSEGSYTLPADEVIDDDLFVGGETVTVNGTVNGDLYVGGGVVDIDGTINGDVLAAGGNLTISGVVEDDVRAAGGNLTVSGALIGDNLTIAGGNITVDDETTIGGSLVFGGGSISSKADVGRGVVGGSGNLILDGPVEKDVQVGVGKLTLGPRATVGGDLRYAAEERATIDEEAIVVGEIKKVVPKVKLPKKEVRKGFAAGLRGALFGFKAWSFLAALVVGLLVVYLLPDFVGDVADKITERPGGTLLWGIGALFLTPPALLLLLIAVIGIPLAFILGMLFVIDLYLAKIFIGVVLGSWLAAKLGREDMGTYLMFTLGLLAYYVLTSLPFVGWLIVLASLFLGLGALFSYYKDLLSSTRA